MARFIERVRNYREAVWTGVTGEVNSKRFLNRLTEEEQKIVQKTLNFLNSYYETHKISMNGLWVTGVGSVASGAYSSENYRDIDLAIYSKYPYAPLFRETIEFFRRKNWNVESAPLSYHTDGLRLTRSQNEKSLHLIFYGFGAHDAYNKHIQGVRRDEPWSSLLYRT